MQTPSSLLSRLSRLNDKTAWERFVDLYAPLLAQWARRLTADANDADDLVQEVFVSLVQRLPEFVYDPGQSFRSWLRTILLNRWRDRLRDRARRARHEAAAAQCEATEEPPDFMDAADYRRDLLARALELIRPEFAPGTWAAFHRHGMSGHPAGVVGGELGMSANAVYQATFRVMRRLRIELDGLVEEPEERAGRPDRQGRVKTTRNETDSSAK